MSQLFKEIKTVSKALKRNYGFSSILLQKPADPIQQLFIDKIKDYSQKKKAAGGKLVDATPDVEKQMQQELDKVALRYGGGPNVDMTKFPTFSFKEPTNIDPQV